jgi:acetyl-CoA C-acetyltransferase
VSGAARDSDIVALGVARTAIGRFGGSLRDTPVVDLGSAAMCGALARSGVDAEQVDQVIFANCRQAGNGINPARTAAVQAGIPVHVPAYTVNMACPSGMKTVMLACGELAAGRARVVVAGGMESMSTMPYLLKGARWEGLRFGDRTLMDSWSDTIDPLCGVGMGATAENLVDKYGLDRAAQDAWAAESHRRAARAREAGVFAAEIVPFALPSSRAHPGGATFDSDENIRPDTDPARLARLPAVFRDGGSVTAGNACSMGDAACALLLTTRSHAAALGLRPRFTIVAAAETAVEPRLMGEGPGASIPLALERAGLALEALDAIEVNEAFAAQILANEQVLGWDRARVNVHGGAIALGHPTGFSGARLLQALESVLGRNGGEYGVAGICGGGGVTAAMVIRREP